MAIDFLGTDEYLALPAASTTLRDVGSTYTYCVWYKPETFSSAACFYGYGPDGNNARIFSLSTSKEMYAYDYFGGGYQISHRSAAMVMSTGTWYHLAYTYSATNAATFYLNGSSVATASAVNGSAAGTYTSTGFIGCTTGGGSLAYFVDGHVEDLRLYKRALSANEVATLAAGYRGPLGGEVLWLPMQEIDGATLSSAAAVVFDMSGNGNHGTPQGGCLGAASYAPRMSGWIPQ